MAWRVVGVTNPARLSSKNNQLVITQDEAISIPIEDIDSLVIDSYGITTTTTLLTTLTNKGCRLLSVMSSICQPVCCCLMSLIPGRLWFPASSYP